jgi:hypothetical protein
MEDVDRDEVFEMEKKRSVKSLCLQDEQYFDVHGSVHLGYIYVPLEVQLDLLFVYCLLFFILNSTRFGCYLHPSSGAQLQRTAIGVYGFGVLVQWSRL